MILRMPIFRRSACALAFLIVLSARADVTLPAILAEHMVVQRGLPVHIWGAAGPGEAVSVSFRGDTRSAAQTGILEEAQ